MAYEAVGFDPSNNTLAPAVQAHLDSGYGYHTFANVSVGTVYTPGTGTLYHDIGTEVVSCVAGGGFNMTLPRTYKGIITQIYVVGDYQSQVLVIAPILGNMALMNNLSGIALQAVGNGSPAATFRINYDIWGWA